MVDVSNRNGPINWRRLAGQVDFVMAKACEFGPDVGGPGIDTYTDAYYEANRTGAESIGAYFGAYFFAHPVSDPVAAFDFFRAVAQLRAGEFYALDTEVSDGLPAAEVAQWNRHWALLGRGRYGAWPWAYSDRAFIEAGNLSTLTMCPLWVADPGAPPTENITMPGWAVTTAVQNYWPRIGAGPDLSEMDHSTIFATRAQLEKLAIPVPASVAELNRISQQVRHAVADLDAASAELRRLAAADLANTRSLVAMAAPAERP